MNKSDINAIIAREAGISKADADRAFDAVEFAIIDALASGETVYLGEIGRLKVDTRKARDARTGRNPRTGEAIQIAAKPAYRTVKLSVGKGAKAAMNA